MFNLSWNEFQETPYDVFASDIDMMNIEHEVDRWRQEKQKPIQKPRK